MVPQTLHHTLIPSPLGVAPAMSIVTPHGHLTLVAMLHPNRGCSLNLHTQGKKDYSMVENIVRRVKHFVVEKPLASSISIS